MRRTWSCKGIYYAKGHKSNDCITEMLHLEVNWIFGISLIKTNSLFKLIELCLDFDLVARRGVILRLAAAKTTG